MDSEDDTQWESSAEEDLHERMRAAHRHLLRRDLLRRDLLLHFLLSLAVVAGVCALFGSWRHAPFYFFVSFVPLLAMDLRRAKENSARDR
ncbi:MAG: hypothetical protein ACTHUU_02035 [Brachybacterium sp.]